ncbi:HD domain-containing phosphohydrolase [Geopsychrobacter electrodiphilus]|uniref:HD domain-containing phosphohydrolase n=1 Tax=Geopsychrobacter electrodiphilus TaxID=225196 RepID=UPI000377566A|nr:HD domain-containing phosphohydrolase [Geopsychrobacter electrodiphilus]
MMTKEIAISVFTSPLTRRIFLLFVICALVPVLSLSLVSYWQVKQQMTRQLEQNLKRASKNTGMSIFDSLTSLESELLDLDRFLSHSSTISPRQNQNLIDARGVKKLRALGLFKQNHLFLPLFGSFPPLALPDDLPKETSLIFIPQQGQTTRLMMVIARDQRRFADEYLVAELNPEMLWEQALRAAPPEALVSVLAPDGSPIFTSEPLSSKIFTKTLTKAKQISSGQFSWEEAQKNYLSSYWTVFLQGTFDTDNLVVLVNAEKQQSLLALNRFSRSFLLIYILALLLVMLLSSIFVRRTLYPLAALQRGTRLIGAGDFTQEVKVHSKDEFSELADSFNVMTRRIDGHFRGLNQTSQTVRLILSALDRQKLIKILLENIDKTIPCTLAAVSLFLPDCTDTIQTTCFPPGASQKPFSESVTILSSQELQTLAGITNYLLLDRPDCLANLLEPLGSTSPGSFLCLPLIHKDKINGCISLRFTDGASLPSESLLRVRQIADQVAIALANTRLVEELDQLNWGTLQALARTVDANSPWTAGHSERVAVLALKLGRQMGLSVPELDNLHRGALLHDIGKIGCPTAILDKPGALTPEEVEILKQHPAQGAKILEPIAKFQAIIPMIRQHHERFDGSGYPDGLQGKAICREARTLIVADVFDALISHRPYRPGWEIDRVKEYLAQNSGSLFDPEILQLFLDKVIPSLSPYDYAPPIEFPLLEATTLATSTTMDKIDV